MKGLNSLPLLPPAPLSSGCAWMGRNGTWARVHDLSVAGDQGQHLLALLGTQPCTVRNCIRICSNQWQMKSFVLRVSSF